MSTKSLRVVSLLPSATELVAEVGAADWLVGRSHECDFPAGLEGLPGLTRPRLEMPRASGDIDRVVREILKDALTVYELDVDVLESLEPDVIVTQDLCDVCAVSLDDVRAALKQMAKRDVEVVSLAPTELHHVWADVRQVGRALGRAEEGEAAARRLEARVAAIAERSAAVGTRPSVLTVEWVDPVMIGGTWMPELVAAAGGAALVTQPGQHAPTLELEALAELDPDVVLIKPCGFELERTLEERELLRSKLPWDQWRAVREGRVFAADGNAYFNRSGPRLVESLEILAACVHPAEFGDFVTRHRGSVVRLDAGLNARPLEG